MSRQRQGGMTLIEVAITVAILALAVGVVLPSMSNLSRADLRKAATLMAGCMRTAFENAALEGKTHRLTFVPGTGTVVVEATDETLRLDSSRGSAVMGASQLLEEFAPPPGQVQATVDPNANLVAPPSDSPMAALMRVQAAGHAAANRSFEPREQLKLPAGVRVLDVWTDGMDQAATEGEVHVHFFPGGYAQDAMVHLEDSDRRVFSLQLQPLLGKVAITDHYVDVPK